MIRPSSPCQALTKKGKPCRAAATEGGLCFFHANPNKAAELGRIGGKKNGLVRVGLYPLPNLDSAIAIRDTVARFISDVYEARLRRSRPVWRPSCTCSCGQSRKPNWRSV
jgi:hypothetical protein